MEGADGFNSDSDEFLMVEEADARSATGDEVDEPKASAREEQQEVVSDSERNSNSETAVKEEAEEEEEEQDCNKSALPDGEDFFSEVAPASECATSGLDWPDSASRNDEDENIVEIMSKLVGKLNPETLTKLPGILEAMFTKSNNVVPDWANIFSVFKDQHVVEAVQDFLQEPVVTAVVLDFAQIDSQEEELRQTQIEELVRRHLADLLTAGGDLLRVAPELLNLTPHVSSLFTSVFGCKSNVTVQENQEQQEEQQENQEEQQQISEAESQADDANAEAVPSAQIVHPFILCDGHCDGDDSAKQLSIAHGNTSGRYIAGTRWKSAIKEDFDICSTCESSGDFEEEYGPFLKITKPSKAPKQLIVLLKEDQQAHVQAHASVPLQRQPRRGPRGPFAAFLSRAASAVAQAAAAAATEEETAAAASGVEESQQEKKLCCPAGHSMNKFAVTFGYTCDACSCRPPQNSSMYGCRPCNFDVCEECFAAQSSVPMKAKEQEEEVQLPKENEQPQEQATRPPPPPPPQTVPRTQRPQAKFVMDVAIPDGSKLEPSSQHVKKWMILNAGVAAWPEGVKMVCVGGEPMCPPTIDVPALAPNQMHTIELPLTAPAYEGRFVTYYRLTTQDEQRFGHRLWVDITVEAPKPLAPPPVAQPQPPAANAQVAEPVIDARIVRWSDKLQQLAEMGFTDVEQNITLLEQENGNMDNVIPRLCC